jgi:hypothetical protein
MKHDFFCILCQSPMFKAHPCPFCKGNREKATIIILRRQNAGLNKWMIQTFYKSNHKGGNKR